MGKSGLNTEIRECVERLARKISRRICRDVVAVCDMEEGVAVDVDGDMYIF
jgi:hypothetical protein